MEYSGTFENTVKRDELFGGADGIPVSTINVIVKPDAEIKRGMILCAAEVGGEFSPVSAKADAKKILAIAACDFSPSGAQNITQAYTSGKFNREKLVIDSAIDLADFENELRKVNIILTSIKEVF